MPHSFEQDARALITLLIEGHSKNWPDGHDRLVQNLIFSMSDVPMTLIYLASFIAREHTPETWRARMHELNEKGM